MPKAYHIRQWNTANETNESRKYGVLHWYAAQNKLDGLGISRLRAQPEKVELFCAWKLMEVLASRAPRGLRGWLVRERTPLTADDMAFLTSFPRSIFELALKYFVTEEIGWLELADLPGESPAKSPETGETPGESPAKSPELNVAGRKSATDRQTDRQTDKQSRERENKGRFAGKEDARKAQTTQFASARARQDELAGIPEEDRTPEEETELKEMSELIRKLQKKQRQGDFTPIETHE